MWGKQASLCAQDWIASRLGPHLRVEVKAKLLHVHALRVVGLVLQALHLAEDRHGVYL